MSAACKQNVLGVEGVTPLVGKIDTLPLSKGPPLWDL